MLSLCLANYALRHEGVWRSGCIDPLTRHWLGVSGQPHAPVALLPGEEPPVPIG
jgi:hypothetical protein